MTAGVYLIHFSEPFKHASHYVGYSDNIEERIALHRKGQGSRLCEVVVKAGIGLIHVRTWVGKDRHFERKLHNRGKSIFCPLCNKKHWYKNAPAQKIAEVDNGDVKF